MIRLNPKNGTVPEKVQKESGVPGCSRAYFELSADANGGEILVVDGHGAPFRIAVKNLTLADTERVVAVADDITSDWEEVGVPDEVRVKVVEWEKYPSDTGTVVSDFPVDPGPPQDLPENDPDLPDAA